MPHTEWGRGDEGTNECEKEHSYLKGFEIIIFVKAHVSSKDLNIHSKKLFLLSLFHTLGTTQHPVCSDIRGIT